ncbi:MAG: alpha/beta fold hydrolase [Solirubrobacteraceae bacterium]
MPYFDFRGRHPIAYTEFGGGPAEVTAAGRRGRTARSAKAKTRPIVLIHGLLLSQAMDHPLAGALAARGNRVITIDLLGHGASERPPDMWMYSMRAFAQQVIALLDHLNIDEAVVMGTSLGANTTLEIASLAPERLRAMVIEMPVLDNALLASALSFTPILLGLTFGEPVAKLLQRATRAVPRRLLPHYGNVVLDLMRQDPRPSAAVLQGLFFGRIAPHRSERRTFTTPTLVIGHRRDPVHPFSDAGMLAEELKGSRLIEASSIVELRLRPERLTNEIARFLDDVWGQARAKPAAPAKSAGAGTKPVGARTAGTGRAGARTARRPQRGS